ncbi:MAG: asparagine synthase (glutamine-hydrolyzing) [Planctomycetes bacterium]|nr:asparagine synthase (glutamine-hydrolyzing) [Planctomycetota bacterium]
MCGIAGKLWFDATRAGDRDVVAAMTAALAHRGPDGDGLLVDGPVALGHRRLAIVDLSERGRQPMTSVDGRLHLVANGEIYNHRELRAQLAADGHVFRSGCDSEVVLPLYRRWYDAEGPDFVDRLDGMFAFALYDADAGRLVLARDRTGQKPLVYAETAHGLSFASELAALGRDGDVDRTPDERALGDFLAYRAVPQPRTAWRGARRLPPAGVLVCEQGRTRVHTTWRLVPSPDVDPTGPSLDDAADELREVLRAAVRKRLMADVEVGALLSGGLDSASVVALMAEAGGRPVRTFTIGFEEAAYDETAQARKVARAFGTIHHEEILRPDGLQLLETVLAQHQEPFADASALPTSLVSEVAARHVKVVLTGDGGDESFAGYDRHRALLLARRLARPAYAPVRAALTLAAPLLAAAFGRGHRSPGPRLQRLVDALRLPPRARNTLWKSVASTALLAAVLSEEGRRRLLPPTPYGPDLPGDLGLNEALALDVAHYLPDVLLVKLDIASMAHGLEARSPFLDRRVLELAAALPAQLKRRGRHGKRVLRRAMASVLPPDLRHGVKRGFGVPLDAWMRSGPLADHAREVLLGPDAKARGIYDQAALAALLDAQRRGEVAAHDLLFTLLLLERWFLAASGADRRMTPDGARRGAT